jgi:hypothetical protein
MAMTDVAVITATSHQEEIDLDPQLDKLVVNIATTNTVDINKVCALPRETNLMGTRDMETKDMETKDMVTNMETKVIDLLRKTIKTMAVGHKTTSIKCNNIMHHLFHRKISKK